MSKTLKLVSKLRFYGFWDILYKHLFLKWGGVSSFCLKTVLTVRLRYLYESEYDDIIDSQLPQFEISKISLFSSIQVKNQSVSFYSGKNQSICFHSGKKSVFSVSFRLKISPPLFIQVKISQSPFIHVKNQFFLFHSGKIQSISFHSGKKSVHLLSFR